MVRLTRGGKNVVLILALLVALVPNNHGGVMRVALGRGEDVVARQRTTDDLPAAVSEQRRFLKQKHKHKHNMGKHNKGKKKGKNLGDLMKSESAEGQQGGNEQSLRLIVSYKNQEGRNEAVLKAKGVFHDFPSEHLISIEVDRDGADDLEHSSFIEFIEEDSVWTEQGTLDEYVELPYSSDEQDSGVRRRGLQYGEEVIPYGIELTQATIVEVGPHSESVCIVDTGLSTAHPDIDSSLATGYDRKSNIDKGKTLHWNNDSRGHGTHVAGTIAAAIGNGIGVRGMGKIPVVIARGLNDGGNAYESDVREAMQQCVNAGSRIISLSLSGPRVSNTMAELCKDLYSRGILVFAAAGNSGKWQEDFPASLETVISVAAVNENERYWENSNYGPWLDIAAPGHRILSTTVNSQGLFKYALYSGTSMATPHAAAAAAILWSHFPQCTNHQIKYALAFTAKDLGPKGCDTDYGYGLVQVKAGLEFIKQQGGCGSDSTWGTKKQEGFCKII